MSRVVPIIEREPVRGTPRRGMTPARRAAVLKRQGPLCLIQGCARPWIEVDHRIPLAMGGPDTLENCEGLCGAHHLAKTALVDVPAIAKAKRRESKPRIVCRRGVMGGEPCIEGTRIPPRCIQSFHNDGYSVEEIIAEYPTLSEAQVRAAIAYLYPRLVARRVDPWPKGRKMQSRGFEKARKYGSSK